LKYKVGDVFHLEKFEFGLRAHRPGRLRPRWRHRNTVGIITAVEKHTDIFESGSSEGDNCYIWFSQIDGKQYCFYENEVEGSILR
jgi:hypothetical protein